MAFDYATKESYQKDRTTGRGGKRKPDVEGMSCKRFVQTLAAGGCPESKISEVTMAVWKAFHPAMRWSVKVGKKWESTNETLSKSTIESAIWFGNGVRCVRDNGDDLSTPYVVGTLKFRPRTRGKDGKVHEGEEITIYRIKLPQKIADTVDKVFPTFLDVHLNRGLYAK